MICPNGGNCDTLRECLDADLCRGFLLAPIACLHFVGFTREEYWSAVKTFGLPDIVHRTWDHRAKAEIVPGDVAVFAKHHPDDEPSEYSWNDSERF